MQEFKMPNRPICDMLMAYHNLDPLIFHMPGHKSGRAFHSDVSSDQLDVSDFLSAAGALDVTELNITDNLHSPRGAILKAMELTAMAYKSDKSYLLVNGSTGGINAMLFSVLTGNDTVIVCRDCHFSVITVLMRIGCRTIFIDPQIDENFGIPLSVTPELVTDAVR
ncbi:MAG: arginine decarboxylase, partial [Clostridiales bacterium]|nr:arginine decarboxylase [Clostridiales bacterium]